MGASKPAYLAVAEFIEEEGHQAAVSTCDTDCRIHSIDFKSKGLDYRVTMSEDDAGYFSVGLAYALPERFPPRDLLLQIAHDIGAAHKATKIEVQDTGIVATVEQFFEGDVGFKPIFWRCVSALKSTSNLFFTKLREAMPPPDPEHEAREAAERFLAALTQRPET